MGNISPDLQRKINKLMRLKYERHKVIMKWTRFFIIAYSVSVFFLFAKYSNFSVVWYIPDFNIKHGFVVFLIIDFLFCLYFYGKRRRVPSRFFFFSYFVFYFLFLFPVLFAALSDMSFMGKIGKILLGISPFLLYIFRVFIVDVVGSGGLVRRAFRSKDENVWNCPGCHEYLLKRPIKYCPYCGCNKHSSNFLRINHIFCRKCCSTLRINDFDFPKYCPHCGLEFKFPRES